MLPVNDGVADEEAIEPGDTQRVDRSSEEALSEAALATETDILDEFVELTGYHRKHAVRLLGSGAGQKREKKLRSQNRIYNDAVREALILLWEAADRICGKRLEALVPTLLEAMERHGHLQLATGVRDRLIQMSAATIDRLLKSRVNE